jgi:hypothetical protein
MVTFPTAIVSLAKEAIAASPGYDRASKNPEHSHGPEDMGVP